MAEELLELEQEEGPLSDDDESEDDDDFDGVKSRDDEPALALLMQAEDEDLVIHSHLPLVDREDHVNM